MKTSTGALLRTLKDLESGKIAFTLQRNRLDAITVAVAVPGERWEIDFLDDGSVEVEVFRSDGTLYDRSKVSELLRAHSDATHEAPGSR